MMTNKLKPFIQSFLIVLAVHLTAAVMGAGEIKGTVSAAGGGSVASVAVYLDVIPGKTFDPRSEHAIIDQRNMKFVPHVLVVLKGTTVQFLNSDATQHNVFWPAISGNKKLANNLGTWPQGQKKSFTFNNPGVVPLLCNVHQEMSGYVVVVSTPYFAVTHEDGSFEIKNVPPGHYTLQAWSEEGKPVSQAVDVTDGTATVHLTVHR